MSVKIIIILLISLFFVFPTETKGREPIAEILLASPLPAGKALNKVRVTDISDHPDRQQLSFRLSIGYAETDGTWVEKSDYHELVENVPAIADDPKTPEDETVPARPNYDELKTLMKTSGKSQEQIILERVLTRFRGTIQ